MGFADTMRILSNINCGLSAINNYNDLRASGNSGALAGAQATSNLFGGLCRNQIAYDMALHGNYIGQDINRYYGYGSEEANASAMMGLMIACSPYMFFNTCHYYCPTPYYNINFSQRPHTEHYTLWHGHWV